MNGHGNIIAKREIVKQGYKVEESNLNEVWREGQPARSKVWDGQVQGPTGKRDEFGESMEGDEQELGEGNEAAGLWVFGRNTF